MIRVWRWTICWSLVIISGLHWIHDITGGQFRTSHHSQQYQNILPDFTDVRHQGSAANKTNVLPKYVCQQKIYYHVHILLKSESNDQSLTMTAMFEGRVSGPKNLLPTFPANDSSKFPMARMRLSSDKDKAGVITLRQKAETHRGKPGRMDWKIGIYEETHLIKNLTIKL